MVLGGLLGLLLVVCVALAGTAFHLAGLFPSQLPFAVPLCPGSRLGEGRSLWPNLCTDKECLREASRIIQVQLSLLRGPATFAILGGR